MASTVLPLEDVVCGMEGLEGPERKLRDGALGNDKLGISPNIQCAMGTPNLPSFLEVMGPHILVV